MKQDLIINFAPIGLIPTKDMTSRVPVAPDEIVEQVLEVAAMGPSMVHLHARETETGLPTYKQELYAEIIGGIREKNKDLVIGVSTSGRDFFEFEKRSEALDLEGELKPDFGSLTLSSLNFNKQASVNSPEMIQRLARKMMEKGIRPAASWWTCRSISGLSPFGTRTFCKNKSRLPRQTTASRPRKLRPSRACPSASATRSARCWGFPSSPF